MQEMLPGFLTAASLAASLLLIPTLLVQAGAPFMGIYTASVLMAIAGTLVFARLGLPVAAAPGAALTSWLVAVVMLAHGVSWQMVLFLGAVVSLVLTAVLAFAVFSRRPGRLEGLVQLFPPCIADGLQGALGLMLLVQGLYQGHLLMSSPVAPVQLGNMADPVAYLSLVGIIAMLALMAVGARWAVFGGVLGTALLQGVKRGLMSNEAGQGTITMAAASAEAHHPCEQGIISALGVFLDTHVICTMTGFIIIMAHQWALNPEEWKAAGTYPKFLLSIHALTPDLLQTFVMVMVSICFCLFAYTCVMGFVTFSEISGNRISSSTSFITVLRLLCVFVTAFGIACSIAGYDLSNLWAFSDLANIIMVYCNVPMLYLGFRYVRKAAAHYAKNDGTPFTSETIGMKVDYWDERKDD